MWRSRRRLLWIIASGAFAFNIAYAVWHFTPQRERLYITHVGLDSVIMIGSPKMRFSRFTKDGWSPVLKDTERHEEDMAGQPHAVAYVSLAPDANFGAFVNAIADLKARRRCNVTIREGGKIGFYTDGEAYLDLPYLVLCGDGVGDDGFNTSTRGELTPDGLIGNSPEGL
jgi:hypothetical protein